MEKPNKPYPTFPLTAHPRGQWVKKIHGKLHWFGPFSAGHEAALQKYHERAKDLHAGIIQSPRDVGAVTVSEVANRFLAAKLAEAEAGRLLKSWYAAYHLTLARFAKHVGPGTAVSSLTPDHFTSFLTSRGGKGINRAVQCIRTLFSYAVDQDWCAAVRFGREFRKTSRSAARATRRPLLFAPGECRAMVRAAEGQPLAMILLALNGGMGQSDVATLRCGDIDLVKSMIDYRRQKTGVPRTIPLWPDTLKAIKPYYEGKGSEDLVFQTRYGKAWVRESEAGDNKVSTIDAVSQEFGKLLASIGIWKKNAAGRPISDGRNFYTLRRTFRTAADGQGDQRAIALVMGHAPGSADMGAVYVQHIGEERLKAVVEHVRTFLLSPPTKGRLKGRVRSAVKPAAGEPGSASSSRTSRKPRSKTNAPASRRRPSSRVSVPP